MPAFCRHGRFLQNCRICSPPAGKPAARAPRATPSSASGTAASKRSGGRSAVVVKRVARAPEDGYGNELVPGLKASGDARRLADELAFATARLAELAADPPGLYAEAALAADREEALWLAFQLAWLSPLAGDDGPFATIERVRSTWASGDPPALGEGAVLGPRASVEPRQPTRTAEAYRAWAARAGSQDAALTGEPGWSPERRFSRVYERLALPGFPRAGRFELLVSLGRIGLIEAEPAELRLGAEAGDAATIAAKRVFGIGDGFLLERRAADLAEAAGVPVAALDLALFNFGQAETARATMGSRAVPSAELRERVGDPLGV